MGKRASTAADAEGLAARAVTEGSAVAAGTALGARAMGLGREAGDGGGIAAATGGTAAGGVEVG
ncbi:MAG: hypothetical protein OEV65_17155, partial [Aquincola sp.]|nr:hypothetical protein [Aquincola sp.]